MKHWQYDSQFNTLYVSQPVFGLTLFASGMVLGFVLGSVF